MFKHFWHAGRSEADRTSLAVVPHRGRTVNWVVLVSNVPPAVASRAAPPLRVASCGEGMDSNAFSVV